VKRKVVFRVLIGLLLILFYNFFVIKNFYAWFDLTFQSSESLDLYFGFDKEQVISLIGSVDEKTRKFLAFGAVIDSFYALFYGIFYFYVLQIMFRKLNYVDTPWVYFPLLLSFFDLLENAGIFMMIKQYPDIKDTFIKIFSFFNQMKWMMAALTFLIFVFLLWKIFQVSFFSNRFEKNLH